MSINRLDCLDLLVVSFIFSLVEWGRLGLVWILLCWWIEKQESDGNNNIDDRAITKRLDGGITHVFDERAGSK